MRRNIIYRQLHIRSTCRTLVCATAACVILTAPVAANQGKANAVLPQNLGESHPAHNRAWRESPLWRSAPMAEPDQPVSRGAVMNALTGQMPVLGSLRDWRQTFQGTGVAPQREIKLLSGDTIVLGIGARPLPTSALAGLGGTALALGLKLGRVSIGSMAPVAAINRAFRGYDELMADTGQPRPRAKAQPKDQASLTWLTARPLESQAGNLDLLLARGRRDVTPAKAPNKKFINGTVWGGNGRLNLPQQWKLHGEWMNSRLAAQDAAQAWNAALDGPVRHPWGIVKMNVAYGVSESGFTSLTNGQPQLGRRSSEVTVEQGVAMGDVSGTTRVAFVQTRQPDLTELSPATPRQSDTLESAANLRLKVTPSVAVTTKATHRTAIQEMAPDAPVAEKLIEHNDGEVGLELKVSKVLAVTMGVGQTRVANDVVAPDATAPTATLLNDEDRVTVGLQHRTRRGALGVQLASKLASDNLNHQSETRTESWNLEAERQLFSWLRLKGGLRLAAQDDLVRQLADDRADRRAEAQIALPILGRFNLTYSEWEKRQSLLGASPLNSLAPLDAAHEYGVKYNLGAREGQAGWGLSLQYA
ncbi:MAG: hypothetical protein M3347_18770, partial [Armatimonadota bacterium]|nr:hypothetical protein [Armatimonadota bacterium]